MLLPKDRVGYLSMSDGLTKAGHPVQIPIENLLKSPRVLNSQS